MNYNHIHQLAVMDLCFVPVDLVCCQISCLNYNIHFFFCFFYWKVVVLNLFFYPSLNFFIGEIGKADSALICRPLLLFVQISFYGKLSIY